MPLDSPYSHRFLQCTSLTVVPRHNILKLSEQRTDSLKLTSDLKHVMAAFVGSTCMCTHGGKEIKHVNVNKEKNEVRTSSRLSQGRERLYDQV